MGKVKHKSVFLSRFSYFMRPLLSHIACPIKPFARSSFSCSTIWLLQFEWKELVANKRINLFAYCDSCNFSCEIRALLHFVCVTFEHEQIPDSFYQSCARFICLFWKHITSECDKFHVIKRHCLHNLIHFVFVICWQHKNWNRRCIERLSSIVGSLLNRKSMSNLIIDWIFLFFFTMDTQMECASQHSVVCARHRFSTNDKFSKIFERLCTRIGTCSTICHISYLF